jgi:hypothetical protein
MIQVCFASVSRTDVGDEVFYIAHAISFVDVLSMNANVRISVVI